MNHVIYIVTYSLFSSVSISFIFLKASSIALRLNLIFFSLSLVSERFVAKPSLSFLNFWALVSSATFCFSNAAIALKEALSWKQFQSLQYNFRILHENKSDNESQFPSVSIHPPSEVNSNKSEINLRKFIKPFTSMHPLGSQSERIRD